MTALIQYLFDGLVFGALLSIVGLGTAVIFRTTRVLNFAQGGIMATSGYSAARLIVHFGASGGAYWLTVVIAAAISALVGAAIGALMLVAASRASDFELSVASLGVSFILSWADRSAFGAQTVSLRSFTGSRITIAGAQLSGEGLGIIGVTVLLALVSHLVIERSRVGLAMRAASEDPVTARSYGVSRTTVTLASWAFGSAIAGVAGVLVGSYIQVDSATSLDISIISLAALVVGGLGSSGGALAGGAVVGLISSVVAGYLTPNYKNTIVFILVLAVLFIRPQGLFGQRKITVAEAGSGPRELPSLPGLGSWKRPTPAVAGAVLACLLVALPFLAHPYPLETYAVALAVAAAVLSVSLLQYYVGELSLGHGALVTVGGFTVAVVMTRYTSVPFFVAALAAVVITAVIGAVTAAVTLRMSGLHLAIATIVLVYMVTEVADQLAITGGPNGTSVPTPSLGMSNLGNTVYYLALGVFVIVAAAGCLFLRSRLGYRAVLLRDAPRAALSLGVSARRVRTYAFAVSSGMAGLAGSALAVVVSFIGPADYGLLWSFTVIVAAVIGGGGLIAGSLIGAAFVTFIPVIFSQLSGLSDGLFGVTLVVFIVIAPGGLPAVWARLRAWRPRRPVAVPASAPVPLESGVGDPRA